MSSTRPVARLAGTERQPEVRLTFDRSAVHATSGELLTDWVKRAPRRHWDKEAGEWVVNAFGGFPKDLKKAKNPDRVLGRAGFQVITDHPDLHESLRDVLSLEELVDPVCRQSKNKPALALVRPRFAGWAVAREILGMAAVWDKENQWFEVPLSSLLLHGRPKPGLIVDKATVEAARETLLRKHSFGSDKHDDDTLLADAATMAFSTGLNLTDTHTEQFARLVDVVGEVPDWFGLDLYPYQRLGAIASLAGRNLITDPTGLGKTRTALAALAIKDVERAVIVVPPVVLTNWARECAASNLAVMPPKPITKAEIKRREKAAKQAVIDAAIAAGIDPDIANRLSFKAPKRGKAAPPATASRGEAASGHVSDGLDPLAPPSAGSHTVSDQASVTDGADGNEVLPKSSGGFFARHRKRTEPVSLLGDFSDPDPDVPGTPEGKTPRYIALFRPGRKEPDLPERGIIIVADSLLAGRPALRKKIAAWNPDALVYDEAHRARTWSSTRAKAMREMMSMLRLDALRLPMTATPLFANPAELASLLALSGHLDPVFGGYDAFVERFCKRNHFNALVAKKEALPELRRILAERVWVRRKKSEVLKDLPKVSRRAKFVDVDLAGFRAAHDEVIDKICDWLDFWVESEGDYPNDDDIKDFSRTQIGLMSPLRKAAGVAKVPVALDTISSWIADEVEVDEKGNLRCERPLLIWAHHHEVIDALVEHAAGALKDSDQRMVGVIAGSTSADKRGYYVDEFQAGRLPILVASISAAGVGITLTQGSDQIFIESSYSVPEVSQAIDRQNRIGQTNPVMVTTLIAEGTLDARLQKILNAKSDIINAVLGDDGADVSVVSDADLDDKAAPSEIIEGLVHIAVEQHKKGKVGPKKAAEQEAA